MINSKKLIKMARKWQKLAAIGRKQISLPDGTKADIGTTITSTCSSSSVAEKGHFVVYTADGKRFVFPIAYLNNYIFRELLVMSEAEFGLSSDGPIMFPCDASFMDYAVSLIQRRASEDIEKALLMSIASRCSISNSCLHRETNLQLLVSGF